MAAGGPRTALAADAWSAMRKPRGRRRSAARFSGPGARCQALVGGREARDRTGLGSACSQGGAHGFSIFSVGVTAPAVWLSIPSRRPPGGRLVFPPGRSRCPRPCGGRIGWCRVLSAARSSASGCARSRTLPKLVCFEVRLPFYRKTLYSEFLRGLWVVQILTRVTCFVCLSLNDGA